jgi:hypothetical protein
MFTIDTEEIDRRLADAEKNAKMNKTHGLLVIEITKARAEIQRKHKLKAAEAALAKSQRKHDLKVAEAALAEIQRKHKLKVAEAALAEIQRKHKGIN